MCFTEDRGMLCVGETGGQGGKGKKTILTMLCHAKAIKRDAAIFLNHSRQESTIFSGGSVNSGRGWNQTWNLLPNKGFRGLNAPRFLHLPPFLSLFFFLFPQPPSSLCLSLLEGNLHYPPSMLIQNSELSTSIWGCEW